MRREFASALIAILPAALAAGQQVTSPTPPPAASAKDAAQTVYYAGSGVTVPDLMPLALTDAATGRCKHFDGTAVLSIVVDAAGLPHNVYFLRPAGNALDTIALKLVVAEHFKPGKHDGVPAATVDSIEVNLKACIETEKNGAGEKVQVLRLQSVSGQKLSLQGSPSGGATLTLSSTSPSQPGDRDVIPHKAGGDISAPVAIKVADAVYSDKAREEKINGSCVISLIVDEHGMPQNVHMIRQLEPSLDQNALNAVHQYRFKPAMKKDGTPVPVMITVEVAFHLY